MGSDMTTTEQFCELVNCDLADVRDIPADRIGVVATHVDPSAAKAALGTITMPFGKHRGELLSEVPREYLHWLVNRKRSTRGVEKMKQKIRKYLKANRR